jgi:transposase
MNRVGVAMSMRPRVSVEIPEETVRIVRAACPKGTRATHLRDVLGPVFADEQFVDWFATEGRSGVAPGLLAMVCVLQSMERMSDREAADAVRTRVDWKYALALPMADAGFHHSVLEEFRQRLMVDDRAMGLLEALLAAADEAGLTRRGGRGRTDSTHVIAELRRLCRWELLGETVRLALDEVAGMAPGWLGPRIRPGWEQRYGRRVEASRLPKGEDTRWAWADQVAADGADILADIAGDPDAAWLAHLPQVQALASIWDQQCVADTAGVWHVRKECLLAGADRILSPHDPEARWSTKRATTWEGYKFHGTESCDDDLPHLITDVQTTAATTQDVVMLETIQADLLDRDRAPSEQYADTGYVTAEAIRAAATVGITVIGPVVCDSSWQAKAGRGFDRARFVVDWDTRSAICPMGKPAARWRDQPGEHGTGAAIRFADADCAACPRRTDCTHGVQGRQITLPPRDVHEIQLANRASQTDPDWRRGYNVRAGVEGTLSEAVRGYGLRHTPHRGLARTHVRHVLLACGMNAARIADWTQRGNVPARQRAAPRFKKLCTQLITAS